MSRPLAARFVPTPLILILLTAVVLRVLGLSFGLPFTNFPDESHHINIAVYFGSGTLNPGWFKYPTLWMYTLAFMYGVIFVFWSGFGLLRSVQDFSALFVWDPGLFFYSARLLASVFGVGAVMAVYHAGRRLASERVGILGAMIMAFSPPMVLYSHYAKADMMMIFGSSIVWLLCSHFAVGGGRKTLFAAAIAMGLTLSTQYTAGLILPLIFWAHFFRRSVEKAPWAQRFFSGDLICAYGLVVLFFIVGTPFSVFDHTSFMRDINDLRDYSRGGLAQTSVLLGWWSAQYICAVAGPLLMGGLLLVGGILGYGRSNRSAAMFLIPPILVTALLLASQNRQASSPNYIFSAYPGVALLMAGSALLLPSSRLVRNLLLGIIFFTGLFFAARAVRPFLGVDTRRQAKEWIESHVPAGSKILLDQPHASPALEMEREQVQRLYDATVGTKHPRSIFFKIMLDSHPGGGYEIVRVHRTNVEMISLKNHVRWSSQGYEFLDVEKGLPALREAGVDYVVLSSAGSNRGNSLRLKAFFDDLERDAELVWQSAPDRPTLAPFIQIYRVSK